MNKFATNCTEVIIYKIKNYTRYNQNEEEKIKTDKIKYIQPGEIECIGIRQ